MIDKYIVGTKKRELFCKMKMDFETVKEDCNALCNDNGNENLYAFGSFPA